MPQRPLGMRLAATVLAVLTFFGLLAVMGTQESSVLTAGADPNRPHSVVAGKTAGVGEKTGSTEGKDADQGAKLSVDTVAPATTSTPTPDGFSVGAGSTTETTTAPDPAALSVAEAPLNEAPPAEDTFADLPDDFVPIADPPADFALAAAAAPAPTGRYGVYRGSNPAEVAAYERWLGRPIPYVLEFWGRGNDWSKIQNPAWVVNRWRGTNRTVVYSIAILPSNSYTLKAGAAGEYDAYWRSFAETFVARGDGDAILRLGWEFNGKFYPWAAGGQEEVFAAYWRRIVDVFRSVPGTSFRYDWSPLAGSTHTDLERAYPGDGYVDFIGLDAYDTSSVHTSREARWANIRDRKYGLAWHRDFARAHGKPRTFPEWGLTVRPRDNLGGGDNPYYVEQMYAWINQPDVAYSMYFEYDAKDAIHRLMTTTFPKTSATFLRLFSGRG